MASSLIYIRPIPVVFVRAYGAYEQSVHRAWGRMFKWMDANGLGAEVDIGYGLAYDDPRTTPSERCRYEACITIPSQVPAERLAVLDKMLLPPGVYAKDRLTGSYESMGKMVTCIRDEWAPRHGLAVDRTRPVITIYRNNPRYCPAETLQADICLPIAALADTAPLRSAA